MYGNNPYGVAAYGRKPLSIFQRLWQFVKRTVSTPTLQERDTSTHTFKERAIETHTFEKRDTSTHTFEEREESTSELVKRPVEYD